MEDSMPTQPQQPSPQEIVRSAVRYLVTLGQEYAKTLPPPVAGPVLLEIQKAATVLDDAMKPVQVTGLTLPENDHA